MIDKVTYTTMAESANALRASSQKLKEILTSVDQKMSKINTTDVYQSEGAQMIYDNFKRLSAKFEAFYTEIMKYSEFLTKTVNLYQKSDKAIGEESATAI